MKTFIRVIEVWVPSRDRTVLEFGSGWYGDAPFFGALSEARCFGMGEGLPGQAWERGHPIVLKQFEGSYFQRKAAAKAAGQRVGERPAAVHRRPRQVKAFFARRQRHQSRHQSRLCHSLHLA